MSLDILFSKYLLFLIILFDNISLNLMERYQKRQEYGRKSDLDIIKNLDDDTYEELVNEIPLLKKVFVGNRKDDTFQFNSSALPMLYRGEILERTRGPPIIVAADGGPSSPPTTYDPIITSNRSIADKRSVTYRTRWPAIKQKTRDAVRGRRWINVGAVWQSLTITAHWYTVYEHITSCYWCGLNDTLIPNSSVCWTIWDAEDTRMRDLGRFFRARCYYYDHYRFYDRQIKMIRWYPSTIEYYYDKGLKTNMFGPYMKGCFKRFVDVGPLYTARGCRGAWLPWRAYTRSFASHRLMRLEIVARGHEDVCVHSPEASLTPYSRAISLYVRYHVCVCPDPYCNAATPHTPLTVAPYVTIIAFLRFSLNKCLSYFFL